MTEPDTQRAEGAESEWRKKEIDLGDKVIAASVVYVEALLCVDESVPSLRQDLVDTVEVYMAEQVGGWTGTTLPEVSDD